MSRELRCQPRSTWAEEEGVDSVVALGREGVVMGGVEKALCEFGLMQGAALKRYV
jgi:hypothetical protein